MNSLNLKPFVPPQLLNRLFSANEVCQKKEGTRIKEIRSLFQVVKELAEVELAHINNDDEKADQKRRNWNKLKGELSQKNGDLEKILGEVSKRIGLVQQKHIDLYARISDAEWKNVRLSLSDKLRQEIENERNKIAPKIPQVPAAAVKLEVKPVQQQQVVAPPLETPAAALQPKEQESKYGASLFAPTGGAAFAEAENKESSELPKLPYVKFLMSTLLEDRKLQNYKMTSRKGQYKYEIEIQYDKKENKLIYWGFIGRGNRYNAEGDIFIDGEVTQSRTKDGVLMFHINIVGKTPPDKKKYPEKDEHGNERYPGNQDLLYQVTFSFSSSKPSTFLKIINFLERLPVPGKMREVIRVPCTRSDESVTLLIRDKTDLEELVEILSHLKYKLSDHEDLHKSFLCLKDGNLNPLQYSDISNMQNLISEDLSTPELEKTLFAIEESRNKEAVELNYLQSLLRKYSIAYKVAGGVFPNRLWNPEFKYKQPAPWTYIPRVKDNRDSRMCAHLVLAGSYPSLFHDIHIEAWTDGAIVVRLFLAKANNPDIEALLKLLNLPDNYDGREAQSIYFHSEKGHLQQLIPLFEAFHFIDAQGKAWKEDILTLLKHKDWRKIKSLVNVDQGTLLKEVEESAKKRALLPPEEIVVKGKKGQFVFGRRSEEPGIIVFEGLTKYFPTEYSRELIEVTLSGSITQVETERGPLRKITITGTDAHDIRFSLNFSYPPSEITTLAQLASFLLDKAFEGGNVYKWDFHSFGAIREGMGVMIGKRDVEELGRILVDFPVLDSSNLQELMASVDHNNKRQLQFIEESLTSSDVQCLIDQSVDIPDRFKRKLNEIEERNRKQVAESPLHILLRKYNMAYRVATVDDTIVKRHGYAKVDKSFLDLYQVNVMAPWEYRLLGDKNQSSPKICAGLTLTGFYPSLFRSIAIYAHTDGVVSIRFQFFKSSNPDLKSLFELLKISEDYDRRDSNSIYFDSKSNWDHMQQMLPLLEVLNFVDDLGKDWKEDILTIMKNRDWREIKSLVNGNQKALLQKLHENAQGAIQAQQAPIAALEAERKHAVAIEVTPVEIQQQEQQRILATKIERQYVADLVPVISDLLITNEDVHYKVTKGNVTMDVTIVPQFPIRKRPYREIKITASKSMELKFAYNQSNTLVLPKLNVYIRRLKQDFLQAFSKDPEIAENILMTQMSAGWNPESLKFLAEVVDTLPLSSLKQPKEFMKDPNEASFRKAAAEKM